MDVDIELIRKYGALRACVVAWCKTNLTKEWVEISSAEIADNFCMGERTMRKCLNDMIAHGELERKLVNNFTYGVRGTNGSAAYYRLTEDING